jgi:hypothetical protein
LDIPKENSLWVNYFNNISLPVFPLYERSLMNSHRSHQYRLASHSLEARRHFRWALNLGQYEDSLLGQVDSPLHPWV